MKFKTKRMKNEILLNWHSELFYSCISVYFGVEKSEHLRFGNSSVHGFWILMKKLSKNQMTWASFLSLSRSSSTEETTTPAFLLGGSVTWTTSKSDLISTFNSCGVNFFMAFDFAFIMLGSVAYLGWFNLKSVLHEENK